MFIIILVMKAVTVRIVQAVRIRNSQIKHKILQTKSGGVPDNAISPVAYNELAAL